MSPQAYARLGGWLYLLVFVTAVLLMYLQSSLVITGDAAATFSQIAAELPRWRLSAAVEVVMFGCDIPLAVIFYILLRPVNANLALMSAAFRFAEAVIGLVIVMWHAAPALLVSNAGYLKGLDLQQLRTLDYLCLKLYDHGFAIALVPFGVHCILLGYLIFRSTYLPKTIGVLLVLAGACYVINSFALFIGLGGGITFMAMLVTGVPAELGLCFWLIIKGVNVSRWNAVVSG